MAMELIVEADGGSRGNPGPAGYGALVRDAASGDVLVEVCEPIGAATNNVAEYRGLIAGLTEAARIDPAAAVQARMDSKLVVEQMRGRWRIKHPDLVPLATRAKRLASGFAAVSYTWVPRAANSRADRLANEAMDAAARGRHDAVRRVADAPAAPLAAPVPAWTSHTDTPTTTLLVRHGQTPLSVERRFAGVTDESLTQHGIEQAKAVAARLRAWTRRYGRIDTVISSPRKRARQTAEFIAAATGSELEFEDGVAETDFGAWEGQTLAEVRTATPAQLDAWLADPDAAPHGGESFSAVSDRVQASLDRLIDRHRAGNVVLVSHVTPIKTVLRRALLAPPEAMYRIHLDLACLSWIDWYADGSAVVRSLNDTSYLEG